MQRQWEQKEVGVEGEKKKRLFRMNILDAYFVSFSLQRMTSFHKSTLCVQLSFKTLLPVHLPQEEFPIKSTRAPTPHFPWNSQCSSRLLKYLMQGLWAPVGPVLNLRLHKTHSMTFLSSMFPMGPYNWWVCITCCQDKRLPQWKSSC